MILAKETFKKFGYWPKHLLNNSTKSIIWRCKRCKKIATSPAWAFNKKKTPYCRSCSSATRDHFYDLSGLKINHFNVLSEHKIVNGNCYWKIRCDCGVVKFVRKGYLKNDSCSQQCIFYRPAATSAGDIGAYYWRQIKSGARSRNNMKFLITPEYAWSLFLSQNGKCALSNVDIVLIRRKSHSKTQSASLDRIDSSKGYVIGNVQWVHKYINNMKWNFKEKEFINLCKKVAKHNS